MEFYLTGDCVDCGTRVWVDLDGTCAAGHSESAVSALAVQYPERLNVEALTRQMQANRDNRWVTGSNLVDAGKYEQGYRYLAQLEPTVSNSVDLHFVYNGLVEATYRLRDHHPDWLAWCIEYCRRDIQLYPKFKSAWIAQDRLGDLFSLALALRIGDRSSATESTERITRRATLDLRIPSFKQLTIIYEKRGWLGPALEVARQAQDYGLDDGTKGGYAGRIARLEKAQQKTT